MFTGIVEELGSVLERTDTPGGTTFRFQASVVLDDSPAGASIAVNGCCLTLTASGDGWWQADAVAETLARTNLADLQPGDVVNLERPVRLQDRLGGHLVQGHVDCVGEIVSPAPDLRVSMPPDLLRYVVEKGSITVDGCSLTVVKPFDDGFSVALIPHTIEVTTFGRKGVGARVNLEVDVMAKYAERLLAFAVVSPTSSDVDGVR
jgi:riboflavin synthase